MGDKLQTRWLIVFLAWSGVHLLPAFGQQSVADVAALVRQLSDAAYSTRETAMQGLSDAGVAAIPELTEALLNADPETRWRASRSLEQIALRGDERTLRKVTRIMCLLGEYGVSGLAEKSHQLRERWKESQVEKITNQLVALGATLNVNIGDSSGLEVPMIAVPGPILSAHDGIAVAPIDDDTGDNPSPEKATNRELNAQEIREAITQIIADPDEADEEALAKLKLKPLETTITQLTDTDTSTFISEWNPNVDLQPTRTISIGPGWKGQPKDWALISQVSRLDRLNIESQSLTSEQWASIAEITSLRVLYLDRCEFVSADAFEFRKNRSDVYIRVVGRGFLGVMGPTDGSSADCRISQVLPGTSAEQAGLQVEDEITAINGKSVSEFQDLIFIVGSLKPGDEVKLEFRRDGKAQETIAVLKPRDGSEP